MATLNLKDTTRTDTPVAVPNYTQHLGFGPQAERIDPQMRVQNPTPQIDVNKLADLVRARPRDDEGAPNR